jgi:hypothetical protein
MNDGDTTVAVGMLMTWFGLSEQEARESIAAMDLHFKWPLAR